MLVTTRPVLLPAPLPAALTHVQARTQTHAQMNAQMPARPPVGNKTVPEAGIKAVAATKVLAAHGQAHASPVESGGGDRKRAKTA